MDIKDNYEIIEKFLRNQMSAEENEDFLNRLKEDEAFREEAQMIALIVKEMKEEQANQDELIYKEFKRAKIINIVKKSLSVAAIFIFIAGAVLFMKPSFFSDSSPMSVHHTKKSSACIPSPASNTNQNLFNKYYTAYNTGGSRGLDDNVLVELTTIFNQMDSTTEIITIINKLQLIYETKMDEYEYSIYKNDIMWYLSLAYLKNDNPQKAKELLEILAKEDNTQAQKLLEEIKNQ